MSMNSSQCGPDQPCEPLFLALMDALVPCTAITDASGMLVATNAAWDSLALPNPFVFGVQVGQDYLQVCRDLMKGEDGNLSIVALGLSSVIRGNVRQLQFEYPFTWEGETYWYGVVAKHCQRVGTLGAMIQHSDLTERMVLEKRLRKSDHLFRATTENALDLIAILDSNGIMVYTNPSLRATLGYATQGFPSTSFVDFVHEEDRFIFSQALASGFKTGVSQFFEYRLQSQEGDWRCMEAKVSVVDNPHGEADTVLLVSRDITQRKEMEQERARLEIELRHAQRLEAIGQLAAGIAHEINTPVQFVGDNLHFLREAFQSLSRVILASQEELEGEEGASEVLKALAELREAEDVDYLCEEIPKALGQSIEGLERVSTIVKAMKFFGHPGTEGRVAVNLNQAISNTLIVARNEWKYVAEVETDFDPKLPDVVCSPSEFNQVVLNLLINAAHAIGDAIKEHSGEKGLIRIRTWAGEDRVHVSIQDNGTGIPAKIREQVFLPFFTTKAVGKGTGQGLAIAHSVLSKHGGDISFESEEGRGTTFHLRLPLNPPAEGGLTPAE